MASFPKNYISVPDHVNHVKQLYQAKLNEPCYVIGNGPSVDEVQLSADDISNGTIFRANWFFLEDKKRFGERVDGFFWSVENKGLREALEDVQGTNEYLIKAFFQPFQSSDAKDRISNKNAVSLMPNYDHWAVIASNPTLARFLMGRPLPTQGMQMIAFAAIVGFKKIYIAGIDLYSGVGSRYAWELSDQTKASLKEKDYTAGYESNHDLEVDLMFLRAVLSEFDIELIGLSSMKLMAPYLNRTEKKSSTAIVRNPAHQNIYVTLADGRYVIGAMALARSLARVTDIPLLVLHSDPYAARALAHLPNVITKKVEKLNNHHKPSQARFADTFTKLRIFELLEYDRVTFIDADCVVLKNIDDLFCCDGILAAPDWGLDITAEFNSGLIAFSPSEDLKSRVYSSLFLHNSSDGGDQGFLNSLFEGEVHLLPPEYNMLKRLPVHHPNLINISEAKVIHYVGDKPWDIHQKRVEFVHLEAIWASFLEVSDWQHEFWMNKTFISKRWNKNGKLSKVSPSAPINNFQQRLKSYGPVKRMIVRFGDKILPDKISRPLDRFLRKLRIL